MARGAVQSLLLVLWKQSVSEVAYVIQKTSCLPHSQHSVSNASVSAASCTAGRQRQRFRLDSETPNTSVLISLETCRHKALTMKCSFTSCDTQKHDPRKNSQFITENRENKDGRIIAQYWSNELVRLSILTGDATTRNVCKLSIR